MKRAVTALCLVAVLAGCGGGGRDGVPQSPRTVRLEWIGHQSFLLRSSLGTKILTNPFTPGSVPHAFPKNLTPDVLLISHEKREANHTAEIENFPVVLRSSVGMGSHGTRGIPIRGTATFPDPANPDILDMNLVFTWSLDGMKFCFPGDLAAPLGEEDRARIAPVDVLFLPVGGRLGAAGREALVRQVTPRLIIPMGSDAAIASWAGGFPRVHRPGGKSILLNANALPVEPVAIVFAKP
jgi:L-ascorbate metabolism protein UlaG (beta-lactamase superfamily)